MQFAQLVYVPIPKKVDELKDTYLRLTGHALRNEGFRLQGTTKFRVRWYNKPTYFQVWVKK